VIVFFILFKVYVFHKPLKLKNHHALIDIRIRYIKIQIKQNKTKREIQIEAYGGDLKRTRMKI